MELSVSDSTITWNAAHAAVQAAVQEASRIGVTVNAAVVDQSGNLAAFLRMPGAAPQSISVAIDKAYTAGGFGFPTADWLKLCEDDEALKLGISSQPRLIIFGGGLPVRSNGKLIGGIGVSGATAEQDEACARVGLAAIGADQESIR